MFQQAAAHYETLTQKVIRHNGRTGDIVGLSCYLSKQRLITASHVVEQAVLGGKNLVVSRWDGHHAAEVVFKDEEFDVAVLRVVKQLDTLGSGSEPVWYPSLVKTKYINGASVAFLTALSSELKGSKVDEPVLALAAASLSFPYEDDVWKEAWRLDGGHVETGFTGGPVFLPNGAFVSVVLDAGIINDSPGLLPTLRVAYPVIASTYPIIEKIDSAIKG